MHAPPCTGRLSGWLWTSMAQEPSPRSTSRPCSVQSTVHLTWRCESCSNGRPMRSSSRSEHWSDSAALHEHDTTHEALAQTRGSFCRIDDPPAAGKLVCFPNASRPPTEMVSTSLLPCPPAHRLPCPFAYKNQPNADALALVRLHHDDRWQKHWRFCQTTKFSRLSAELGSLGSSRSMMLTGHDSHMYGRKYEDGAQHE
nr:hypothetical protein CFP56_00199 [Quercus suber]